MKPGAGARAPLLLHLLLLGLLAGSLVSGCGGGEATRPEPPRPPAEATPDAQSPSPAPSSHSAAQQLRGLLARRAAALEDHDVTAYAATATGAQGRRDARAARNARALMLRDVRLEAETIKVRGRRATLRARASYRLAGLHGRWMSSQSLRAVRSSSGWRVSSASSRPPRAPWEIARYGVQSTRHFRVLAPTGVDPSSVGLGATLERAYSLIRERLPDSGLDRRYLVVVAADTAQARALTGGLPGVDQLTAVTDSSVRTAGPAQRVTEVISLRLLVPWARFSSLLPDAQLRAMTHELTHAALARRTSGRAPAWLQEGIALYVSGDRRTELAGRLLAADGASAARNGLSLPALSRPDSIGRLAGSGLSGAYAYSSAAAFYIASRFGERKLLALLTAFGNERLGGRAGPRLGDAATRRTLGVGLRRLERDLRDHLRAGAGRASG